MNLVLYRKYRPKNLSDIVAQKPIVNTLEAALKKKTLGHALLFTGPRGIGKTSLARIIAHRVNDIKYDLNQINLDIIEIDAASNGRIDEIRDLRENIKLMPVELKYKIYIIDEVHMLTKEAFNALLKTLEEPPTHIIFILATTELHKVPKTIISRCQHFALQVIPDKDLAKHLKEIALKEKIKIDDQALDVLAKYANGGLRDGLSLLEQIASLNKKIDLNLIEEILGLPPKERTEKLINALITANFKAVAINYQELMSQGFDPIILTTQIMDNLRLLLKTEEDNLKRSQILSILEDLLEVLSSQQPQISLEICLLKNSQIKPKKIMNKDTAKMQPQDIEAEKAILGAILINPQAIAEIDTLIKEPDFFDKKHQHIIKAALEVYQNGEEVDILTVSSRLKANKQFKAIGGNDYLNQLINTVPTSAHIKTYARIIATKARRRGLIEAAKSLNELAFNEKKDLNQIIEEAEISLFNVSQQHIEQNVIRLEEILKTSFEELKAMRDSKNELRGISSGFSNLDNFLAGFQKSDLIIIAARPGMGKTGFALNLAYNIAHNIQLDQQKTVLYYSLEMSKDQLVDRVLSMHTGVDNWNLRTRHLSEADFKKLEKSQTELDTADLYIDDTPGLNISEIRTKARRLNYKQKVDIIMVDYLQLMRGLNPSNGENRVAEISEISRGLKLLAKELNIPIIALSQLSRQTETRDNKQPALADLRDSGAIEQDADIVAFLYREEYYNPDLEDKKGLLEFQVRKHRNGPVGTLNFFFNKEIQRYLVLDKGIEEDKQ